MSSRIFRGKAVLVMSAACTLGSMKAFERGTDVTFRGELRRLEQESINKGKIVVRLNEAELPVRISTETQIESHGNIIGMDDLGVGHFVQVVGFFSTSGIEAKQVQVLDDRGAEFRIRGTIDSVRKSGNTTVIGLSAGNIVADDGVRVRFEGTLQRVEGRRLFPDTRGGGAAVVVLDDSTVLKSSINLNQEYEVSGRLNLQLEVVADWVESEVEPLDDHGIDPKPIDDNKGKDNPPPDKTAMVRKEINLNSVVTGSGLVGHAGLSFSPVAGNSQQEFEVETEDSVAGKEYQIEIVFGGVGTISLGSLTADSKGRGKAKFATNASGGNDPGSPLPAGVDVRNITGVRVLLNGTPVLAGQF